MKEALIIIVAIAVAIFAPFGLVELMCHYDYNKYTCNDGLFMTWLYGSLCLILMGGIGACISLPIVALLGFLLDKNKP